MWQADIGTCYKFGIDTITGFDFRLHERVRFLIGPDEPDAHDETWVVAEGGSYGGGLGYHAREAIHSGWQAFGRNLAPWAPTWIIINGTTKPLNWSVYGQLADISCTDPCPVAFIGADHTFVRESLALARQCGAPRRMFACLEAFALREPARAPRPRGNTGRTSCKPLERE